MKPNELMIGDWVLDGTQIAQITSITFGGVIETTAHEFSNLEVIEPISLTAEILESNGFKKINNNKFTREQYSIEEFFGDGGIIIRLTELSCGEWELYVMNYDKFSDTRTSFSNELSFLKVHELQHAMKLCGIEKEIEL